MRVVWRLNSKIRPTTKKRGGCLNRCSGLLFFFFTSKNKNTFISRCVKFVQKPPVRKKRFEPRRNDFFFLPHHVIFPKAISEDKCRGKGRAIVWLYENPPHPTPPIPEPLPVCEESHCGPNTVLILLLRGVGVRRDKSIFSSALLN